MIISELGKEQMEELLAQNPPRDGLQGSTITCRSGDPLIRSELVRVSAQYARYRICWAWVSTIRVVRPQHCMYGVIYSCIDLSDQVTDIYGPACPPFII